jgi:hypothetical protein
MAVASATAAMVAVDRQLFVLRVVALAVFGPIVFSRHAKSFRSALDYRGSKPIPPRCMRIGGEYRGAGPI